MLYFTRSPEDIAYVTEETKPRGLVSSVTQATEDISSKKKNFGKGRILKDTIFLIFTVQC